MKILAIGAGLIRHRIVNALAGEERQVLVLDNLTAGFHNHINSNAA